jgi:hypothetical protein
MVDVQLIKDTINELLEANVDKDTIFSTLRDIGVEEGEIEKYYKEITNNSSSTTEDKKEKIKEEVSQEKETEENKKEEPKVDKIIEDSNKIKEKVEDDKHQEGLLNTSKEVNIINEKEQEVNKPVNITTNNSIDNSELKEQLKNLQEQIVDIKAQIGGLTKIMKDILEENRNILNKL